MKNDTKIVVTLVHEVLFRAVHDLDYQKANFWIKKNQKQMFGHR